MAKTTTTIWRNDCSLVLIVIKAIITAVYCLFLAFMLRLPIFLLPSSACCLILGSWDRVSLFSIFKTHQLFPFARATFAIGPKGFWCNWGELKTVTCGIEKFFSLVLRMYLVGKVVLWLMSNWPP